MMHQMNPWTSSVSGTHCLIIPKSLFKRLKAQTPRVRARGKAMPFLAGEPHLLAVAKETRVETRVHSPEIWIYHWGLKVRLGYTQEQAVGHMCTIHIRDRASVHIRSTGWSMEQWKAEMGLCGPREDEGGLWIPGLSEVWCHFLTLFWDSLPSQS